jgi:hypothetical protein
MFIANPEAARFSQNGHDADSGIPVLTKCA